MLLTLLGSLLTSMIDGRAYQVRLDEVEQLRCKADMLERAIVSNIRSCGGTWAVVGELFGITRQAAFKRFKDIS